MPQYVDNIFTKIIRKQIPAEIVHENDLYLAFQDINPRAATHILVVPKQNYMDFDDFIQHSNQISEFFQFIHEVVRIARLSSYRLQTNNGANAGQEIFHFHFHILSDEPTN